MIPVYYHTERGRGKLSTDNNNIVRIAPAHQLSPVFPQSKSYLTHRQTSRLDSEQKLHVWTKCMEKNSRAQHIFIPISIWGSKVNQVANRNYVYEHMTAEVQTPSGKNSKKVTLVKKQ